MASSSRRPPRREPIIINLDSSNDGSENPRPQPLPTYNPGAQVEIIGAENGLLGSFYEATITHRVDLTHYEVEFITLQDNRGRGPLMEVVQVGRIRPRPPHVAYEAYQRGDRVDCRALDGYWSGRVTDVVWEGGDRSFEVHFPLTGDNHMYRNFEMRPHLDWIEGRWSTQPHFRFMLR